MTYSKSNKELVEEKLQQFKEAIQDKELLIEFLSLDLDHFYDQHRNFDPWLYTLLHVDTFARIDELNKGLKDEENM